MGNESVDRVTQKGIQDKRHPDLDLKKVTSF
jgi:hypothetical protein